MNKVCLIGRLTADVKLSKGDNPASRYTLAVDRRGEGTDFINCVTFGKGAEFADKYLSKGMKIGVTGRISTGSYTNKDGIKVYTTDVIVEEHFFCERKGAENSQTQQEKPQASDDGFINVDNVIIEDLPFN